MPLPNPPVPFASLLSLMTTAVLRGLMVDFLVAAGIRADLWPAGGVGGSVLTDVATIGESFSQAVIDAISAFWLPTAAKGWLDWLAFYFYGQLRTPATFATGQLTLTNTGGGTYTYPPGGASFQNTITGATYTNTDAIALGPAASQTIGIQATALGTGSNAGPQQVSTLVTVMPGVAVANANPVLGVDAQTDDDFRQTCFDSLGARSVRGPRTAYAYAIKQATNSVTGTQVNINRSSISSSSHTGKVVLFVASPEGAPDPNDVTGVNTASELIARPEGVGGIGGIIAFGAEAVPYGPFVSITVYMPPRAGLTQDVVVANVVGALDLFFENYPIGGRSADGFTGVHASGVEAAAASPYPDEDGTGIYAVDGAIDLPLIPGQVATNAIARVQVRFVSQ